MTETATDAAATALTIAVISDVVCPWCYLGKRRLARALEQTSDVSVSVSWRPFQLDPTIPPEGIGRHAYLERKFGSIDAVAPMHARLAAAGAVEGIDFAFDKIARSPNTVDAHRLIRWAEAADAADDLVERLFRSYFTDGRDIGDRAVLVDIAAEVGLDADTVADRLATDRDHRPQVEAEVTEAFRIGVTGVPCFVIDGRYAVVGAQPADTLAGAISEAAQRSAPSPAHR